MSWRPGFNGYRPLNGDNELDELLETVIALRHDRLITAANSRWWMIFLSGCMAPGADVMNKGQFKDNAWRMRWRCRHRRNILDARHAKRYYCKTPENHNKIRIVPYKKQSLKLLPIVTDIAGESGPENCFRLLKP